MGPTTDIRIKRKRSSGDEGVKLVSGELYYNYGDKTLYIGNSDEDLTDKTPIVTTGYIPGICTYDIERSDTAAGVGYYTCSDVGTSYYGKRLSLKFDKGPEDQSVTLFDKVYIKIGDIDYGVKVNGSDEVLGKLQNNYMTDFIMDKNDDPNPSYLDVVFANGSGGGSLIWEEF